MRLASLSPNSVVLTSTRGRVGQGLRQDKYGHQLVWSGNKFCAALWPRRWGTLLALPRFDFGLSLLGRYLY